MSVQARLFAFFLAALSGLLLSQTYSFWPLLLIGHLPMLWAIRRVSLRFGLLLAWFSGTVFNLAVFYWVVGLINRFAGLNLALSLLGHLLLALMQGGVVAMAYGLLLWLHQRRGLALGFGLPLALVAAELVYPQLFKHFIGSSFYPVLPLIQIVEWGGVLALTFLVGLANGAIYEAIQRKGVKARLLALSPAILAFALSFVWGSARITEVDAAIQKARRLKVGIVQVNIGGSFKDRAVDSFVNAHQSQTEALVAEHPEIELVVWPESAYNRWLVRHEKRLAFVQAGVKKPLLFGTLTYDWDQGTMYNSAFLLDEKGLRLGAFDKIELLMFGETLPGVDRFPALKHWYGDAGILDRGTSTEALVYDSIRMLPMICYEDILPDFLRFMWHGGGPADVLVNLTNDSWYGDTLEPGQHLAMALFRSLEARRSLIRSTNTGISAVVDPAGRVIAKTPQWEKANLVVDVPILQGGQSTLYMRFGDWLGWLCVLILVGVDLKGRLKRRKTPPPEAVA